MSETKVELPENWTELPEVKDHLAQQVKDAVGEQTQGLVSKRDELLKEVKKLKGIAKQYEDIDPEKAREALQQVADLEEKQLMDKGLIDELFEKKTERMRKDHEDLVSGITAERDGLQEEVNTYKSKLEEVSIEGGVRDAEMGMDGPKIHKTAWPDVLIRAKSVFKINDQGNPEPRDQNGNIIYGKDATTPMTYKEWLESLKESAPHLWEASNKGGSGGYSSDASGRKAKTLEDHLEEAIKAGDIEAQIRLKRLIANARQKT